MQAVLVSATSASCASALAVQASKQLVQPREQLYTLCAVALSFHRVASVFKHASPCSARLWEGAARRNNIRRRFSAFALRSAKLRQTIANATARPLSAYFIQPVEATQKPSATERIEAHRGA